MAYRSVAEALATIDRAWFLPAEVRALAEQDRPLPIGHDVTCSQPTTVRHMLEFLEPRRGDRVLDVGSGSGWTTALLAWLVGPDGVVVGVEIMTGLVEAGAANVAYAASQFPDLASVRIEPTTPGRLGLPEAGPFDRILVSANADELPPDLVGQLAPGGRMVIPVRSEMLVVDRAGDAITSRRVGTYRFVPLLRPPPVSPGS